MSERLIMVLGICGAAIIGLVIMALTAIALTHDGGTEGQIIIALIGFASTILASASALFGHWQGANKNHSSPQP